MGINERKQRQKEEVRLSILTVARKMLNEEGWQSLSIRRIAEAIEYSIPVIYDHFENKEALQLELTKEGFCLLAKQVQDARVSVEQASAQIEKMALAYWDFAFSNKQYYQMMFGLGMPTCETVKKIEEIKFFGEQVRGSISELIANSTKPEQDVHLKFYVFWSMLHGLISINLEDRTASNCEMQQMVLMDSIQSFIKSIEA